MSDNANSLTICGLAKAADVHIETIRYSGPSPKM